MIITLKRNVDFFEVDPHMNLTLEALSRMFQDAATLHSEKVGLGARFLYSRGVTWVLSRLEIEIDRYPRLGDTIEITTWSSGFEGHQGMREYAVFSGGEKVARGSSIWAFLDLRKKRVTRIPEELILPYENEERTSFGKRIDLWQAPGRIQPEQATEISLRFSDFDFNGHVNNTVYLNFLETMIHKTLENKRVKSLNIRFKREIGRQVEEVRAGWQKKENRCIYNIFSGDHLFADGEITPCS